MCRHCITKAIINNNNVAAKCQAMTIGTAPVISSVALDIIDVVLLDWKLGLFTLHGITNKKFWLLLSSSHNLISEKKNMKWCK